MIEATGATKAARDIVMGDIFIVQGAPHRVMDEPTYVYPYGPNHEMVSFDLQPADGRGMIRGAFNLFPHMRYNICNDVPEGCEICADGCDCEVSTGGCGHYGCWGRNTYTQRCHAADGYAARTRARLSARLSGV